MPDPYRVSGPVDPDPPPFCSHPAPPLGCSAFVPHSPHFPASIGFAAAPRRALPGALARALTAAATTLLLVASASLSAITYTVVHQQLSHARGRGALAPPPLPSTPGLLMLGGAVPLSVDGPEEHAVEALWQRAERLAAAGADVTLARAALPRAVLDADLTAGAVRVVREPRKGTAGLRVVALSEHSAAALAGLRQGDLITAVNGFAFGVPEDGTRAFAAAREAHALVAEVWREGRRVVLRVDWHA